MTQLKTIPRTSLVDEAFEKLSAAISSGEFEPGQRLSESALARQLGISRGPLREALQRLEGKVVTRTPRLGVRIINFGRPALEQIFFVREALEGMAARLAAENSSSAEIDSLADLLSVHADQPELKAGQAYMQRSEDEDFHVAIARAAKCERIQQLLVDEVYSQLRLYRARSSMRPGRAKAALEEHRTIVAALQAHDPSAAEREMRRHIRNSRLSALAGLPTHPA